MDRSSKRLKNIKDSVNDLPRIDVVADNVWKTIGGCNWISVMRLVNTTPVKRLRELIERSTYHTTKL